MKRGAATVETLICVGIFAVTLSAAIGAVAFSQTGMTAEKALASYESEVENLKPHLSAYKVAQASRDTGGMVVAERAYQKQLDKIQKARKTCERYGVVLP